MAWPRKSLPENRPELEPTLVGFDLNASRTRAVLGRPDLLPRPVCLDGTREELPMVLSLQGRHPEVGRAGVSLCRQSPHLTCVDFLASLGEARTWVAGRHCLDAAKAVALVLERLEPVCAGVKGLVLTVPAYLTREQVTLLTGLATKAGLPVLGSVKAPLANAWAVYSAEPWTGLALVLDADDHAFSATTLVADGAQIAIQATQIWPQLNLHAWKARLLDRVADRCVRQSRRDPRDSATAEQSLYEQLEDALDLCAQGQVVELLIQTAHWYQNLLLRPEEILAFCERLVGRILEGIQVLSSTFTAPEALRAVIVTRAAARLPGLVAALENYVSRLEPAPEWDPTGDFGEDLLLDGHASALVAKISADAAARAAHDLAVRCHRGELPRGHLDLSLPLPGTTTPSGAENASKRTLRVFSEER
jgi:molecular chaperone DnaK (HSP70)